MESNITRYLLDTNAIRRVSYDSIVKKRNSNTVFETTQDIITELGDRSVRKQSLLVVCGFGGSTYQKMTELLEAHKEVRCLLDYYNNKGMGDVGIIAYALTVDEDKLLKDTTIIITDDKGVSTACDLLNITHITPREFMN